MTKESDNQYDRICKYCKSAVAEKLEGYYMCQNRQSDHYRHLLDGLHGCKKDFEFRPFGSYILPKITTQSPSC